MYFIWNAYANYAETIYSDEHFPHNDNNKLGTTMYPLAFRNLMETQSSRIFGDDFKTFLFIK